MVKNIMLTKIVLCAFIFLLTFLFSLYIISSVCFIFCFSLSPFYSMISFFIGCVFSFFYAKKNLFSFKDYIYVFLVLFLIALFSFVVSGHFFDSSCDGRKYHQAAIMLLSRGWNPIFDDVYMFAGKLFPTKMHSLIWVENYPKYAEILQANISLFFKIEYSKAINFLLAFMLFFYSFYVLSKRYFCRVNYFYKLLFSFLFSFSPVVVAQLLTFYVDMHFCIFIFLILFSILDIETTPPPSRKKTSIHISFNFIYLFGKYKVEWFSLCIFNLFCLFVIFINNQTKK